MNIENIVQCARSARLSGPDFPGPLRKSDAIAAALALNRPDWLRKLGCSLAEAIHHLDSETLDNIYPAQVVLANSSPLVEA
jgi:hypothetical protein